MREDFRSVGFGCVPLATPLQFGFQFGDPRIAFSQLPTQERDFLEQIVNLSSQFIHHPRSVPSNPILGKMDLLNSYTGITRRLQYYEPVRHPRRPSLLLTEFWLRATTSLRWGFPCSDNFHLHACRRQYPGGTVGCVSLLPQRRRPSPLSGRVGFRITVFEACSAFTHVPACMLLSHPR